MPAGDDPDRSVATSNLAERADAWVAAGIVTREQADRIVEHESALVPQPATGGPLSDRSPARRTTTGAEAIGYVGAALAVGALLLLFGEVWGDLLDWAKLTLIAVLTAAVVAGGALLRTTSSDAMRRLSSVLWTAGVAGSSWFAGTLAHDVLALEPATVTVTAGSVAFVVAAVLYGLHPRALLQLALAVSLLVTLVSALSIPVMQPDAIWYGLLVASVGAAWLVASEGGALPPVVLAKIVGSGLVLIGVQVGSFGFQRVWVLVAGVAVAAVLVGVAVHTDELHRLVIGALGLFVFVPQVVFEVFGDVIGAPATLLLVGVLLVLLSVGLGRARRGVASSRGTAARATAAGGEAT